MCHHAAEGAKTYYDEMTAYGDRKWDAWLDKTDEIRRLVAAVLNATPEEIAFLSNTSTGLNVAANLLHDTGEVLTMTDDYPSVTLPWLHRKRPVRFLPSRSTGSVTLDDIEKAVGPDTQIVAVSHVQYRTGFRLNLEELGELCRSRGLYLVVDATQSVGTTPIDTQRASIDVFIFSGYKWVAAGYGIAPLFVRRDVLQSRGMPAVGWRTARDPYALVNDRLDLTTEARGLELGHPPFPGVFALGGALRLLDTIGLANIEDRIDELTSHLHARMDEVGISVFSPRPREHRAGITMLRVPDPAEVTQRLKERNVYVSARGPFLRVSTHFYNNREDIDRFALELTRVLQDSSPSGSSSG